MSMHSESFVPPSLVPASLYVDPFLIRRYATLTCDNNPIHLDPDFAITTPMGGIIAHGTLSLALIWQALTATLGVDAIAGVRLNVRFIYPVRAGNVVTAGGTLRFGAPVYDVWVRNDIGKDVIVGTADL
jgi:3-hydroxybutyryl-CoA dehydratase